MQSTLTSKGQTTIPKEVREKLGIKPGDTVKFFFDRDGGVRILPMIPMAEISGVLRKSGRKPLSVEEMDRAIAEGATDRFNRAASGTGKPARRKA